MESNAAEDWSDISEPLVRKSKSNKKSTKKGYVAPLANGLQFFTPKPNQKTLINKIIANDLVFCEGVAGTGKSSTVLYHYCKEYLNDVGKQIYVIRTPVEAGEDRIGFLPNSVEDKLEPHFASARSILNQFLTKGKVDDDVGKRIHFKIPNFVLGETFDNCLVVIDEAQMLPRLILKLLLERIGHNSKVVVLGDSTQVYTSDKKRNALSDALGRFFTINEENEVESKFDNIAYHSFGTDDVERSELVKTVISAYSDLSQPRRLDG